MSSGRAAPRPPLPGDSRRQGRGGRCRADRRGQAPSSRGWGAGQRKGLGVARQRWGLTPSAAQRRGLGLSALSHMTGSAPTDRRVIVWVEWDRYQALSGACCNESSLTRPAAGWLYSGLLLAHPDSVIRADSSGNRGPSCQGSPPAAPPPTPAHCPDHLNPVPHSPP